MSGPQHQTSGVAASTMMLNAVSETHKLLLGIDEKLDSTGHSEIADFLVTHISRTTISWKNNLAGRSELIVEIGTGLDKTCIYLSSSGRFYSCVASSDDLSPLTQAPRPRTFIAPFPWLAPV
jgi:hypothetical protein